LPDAGEHRVDPGDRAYFNLAAALSPDRGSMGHLIFDIGMGFISFGSVAILFASLIGLAARQHSHSLGSNHSF
jgi:hypothetical protein